MSSISNTSFKVNSIEIIEESEDNPVTSERDWSKRAADPQSGTPTPKYILHMTYTVLIKILFKAQTMLVTK